MMKNILKTVLLSSVIFSQLIAGDLSKVGNIVTDSTTQLQWQDDAISSSNYLFWSEAINYCENLTLDGHSDWRLPNKNELLSLVDYSKFNPVIKENIFENISSNDYWSSTTNADYSGNAWGVDFSNGYTGNFNKTETLNVRCVRAGQ